MNIPFINSSEFGASQSLSFCYFGVDFCSLSNSEARNIYFIDKALPGHGNKVISNVTIFLKKKKKMSASRPQYQKSN